MHIRKERAGDGPAIRLVNEAAFPTGAEANLVDVLRGQATPLISLVAEEGGVIVGHILFSPVTLADHLDAGMMGLAPMAVVPTAQRRGFGSALVRSGLTECERANWKAVVVLGHPGFYPRFGFVPASRFGIGCEYKVPDDVFMAIELEAGSLRGRSGIVRYQPAFARL